MAEESVFAGKDATADASPLFGDGGACGVDLFAPNDGLIKCELAARDGPRLFLRMDLAVPYEIVQAVAVGPAVRPR